VEVKVGLAAEYGRVSFDVGLGEADLARLLVEHQAGTKPSALAEEHVFLLLWLEAERYKIIQSPKFGEPADASARALGANRKQFAGVLADIKGTSADAELKRMGVAL
jgi:hypothetical protein